MLPVTANSADFVWTAAGADFADGFAFASTGKEVLLIRNDNAGAQTVTINSQADPYKRTGDITTYSVGIGEYAVFYPPVDSFRRSDGTIWGAAAAADVMLAVLRLPD